MDFHWLRLRATSHPTEDSDKVAEAMLFAAGAELELEGTHMATHHGAELILFDAETKRNREIRACLDRVLVGADRETVLETLDARMDDDGVLYFRLDKQAAARGEVKVGVFDDPILVRVKVQVHPFSREGALAAWREWAETPSRA